ncbi:chromosome segregation protein SMC [Adlercreutzia sp. ZJ304]|uniref:chromosome segregation protein SMC n=1 Tax=Adlercreutzia sp. ZJ304 TaxID=2709791 RepID=UPI001F14D3F6|nr:chromosome segregation protein SMC [Adlercreutzia sp. ZJ304]
MEESGAIGDMYLKSLVLKGFKSFADRSVLSLEPGITAVVGPNGSGKSNISDAVLWVLGERNARHLRGQAMEDVIFAGSSARKATGVAEVELVLDNSDGTLPVDYNEVSIARRMYRSGESEYLINGTLARRMDVLDILHDSGLGTGTHSIISQGSLDSILQSDAADRRALIEEAAGVLKHKQRKAKSERKLEKMEGHVARVRDVVSEVERQLGPLSRKAKKAQTYADLSTELSDIKLDLAVDDLRGLQVKWDENKQLLAELNQNLEAKRSDVDSLEDTLALLQEQISQDVTGAGELSRNHQACRSAAEHLDSTLMRIRDRRRDAKQRTSELQISLDSSRQRRNAILADLSQANSAYSQANEDLKSAKAKVAALEELNLGFSDKLQSLQANSKQLAQDERETQAELSEFRRRISEAREARANSVAYQKVLAEQLSDAEAAVLVARADANAAQEQLETTREALAQIAEQEKKASNLVASCVAARKTTREALDDAKSTEQSLSAQVDALEEMERASEQNAGAARAWIAEHIANLPGNIEPLSGVVKASPDVEALTEMLLATDVMSLLIDNFDDLTFAMQALPDDEAGEVTFLLRNNTTQFSASNCPASQFVGDGHALIEDLKFADSARSAVIAALGDIVVCDTLGKALAAHKADTLGLRFATNSGDVVWPFGKVTIGCNVDEGRGVLSRVRRIEELKSGLEAARNATRVASEQAEAAEARLTEAQGSSLDVSRQLALMRGNVQSDEKRAEDAANKLQRAKDDLETLARKSEQAALESQKKNSDSESLEARVKDLQELLDKVQAQKAVIDSELEPIAEQAKNSEIELAEAKLTLAKVEERVIYAERMATRRSDDLDELSKQDSETAAVLRAKSVSAQRLESLLGIFENLVYTARVKADEIGKRAMRAEDESKSFHSRISETRQAAQDAHKAYDLATEKLNDARVQNARLEMQVEAAVTAITQECGVPVDIALSRPQLEDRPSAEETAIRLSKRISNLGTINPDAANEYRELKERFDYLSAQLDDLDSARRCLARINRVIDTRMKDDFARTYKQVDENFQQVFSTLFPGGAAHLSLDMPDDLENSGVEVNAQPAGKRIAKMSLMSGGEKSLTALALLFAVYKTRSTPFYILDEVEAALDDTNLRRLSAYIDSLRYDTQLIMITHQRRTMEMADVLFGVSMQADGVTKVISQKLDRALEYAE